MCTNAIAALEFDASTREKAQQDTFEFALDAPGIVRVTNTAHDDEDPADTYHAGACKHRVAVAIRLPVLAAAIVRNREHETENSHSPGVEAMTDGGQLVSDEGEDQDGQADADADLEAQFRALFARATAARECVFGTDHCQGPEGEVFPCFDCHMADALDHYPADSTAVADAPDLETVVVTAEADADEAEE